MSTYNSLSASFQCPRCGAQTEGPIDCYFGSTGNSLELKIGDPYPWVSELSSEKGGRPENGNTDGRGYGECTHCKKDSFFHVLVRGDLIVAVKPNLEEPGYILD